MIGEIAMAVVLLVGAGLMGRSLQRMRTIPLGYDPSNVIAIDLDLPSSRYQAREAREQFIKQVEERIRGLPGVTGVGTTRALPLESGGPDTEFGIDTKPHVEGQPWPSAFYTAVTPGYFRAMGMSLVRGRGLTDADDHPTADRVVVLNETAVRMYWGDENPVGQYIAPGGTKALVVGIVTMNDLMSSVMGEWATHVLEEQIVQRDENSWLVDGVTPISDVMRAFDIEEFPENQNYETIAGFIMYMLRKIPKRTDSVKYAGYKFEVVDIDSYKIDQLLVTRVEPASNEKPAQES